MAGVALVVVVVDLAASGPGVVMLVGVVIDLVALEPGVIFIVVLVDLFTFAAALRASSIIMAISMTTNIFFISKSQRKRKTGVISVLPWGTSVARRSSRSIAGSCSGS